MRPLLFAIMMLALLPGLAFGKGKKEHEEPMKKIETVSPAAITLKFGRSDDNSETFSITAATKIFVDGAPATADQLRAGMEARVTPGPDKSAEAIHAKGAVAHPAKHRVG